MKAQKAGLAADKFVIIASPYAPLPIVELMKTKLNVPPTTPTLCQERFATEFDSNWEDLLSGAI